MSDAHERPDIEVVFRMAELGVLKARGLSDGQPYCEVVSRSEDGSSSGH